MKGTMYRSACILSLSFTIAACDLKQVKESDVNPPHAPRVEPEVAEAEPSPQERMMDLFAPKGAAGHVDVAIGARSASKAKRMHHGGLGGKVKARGRSSSLHQHLSAAPNTEAYDTIPTAGYKRVVDAPLSTFSIDVDTASYANLRRILREGRLPVKGAVRIEEMLNYFDYADPSPTDDAPFAVHTELGKAPWNDAHHLVRIAIKGKEVARGERPPSNLVFLLDVSGSMNAPDKLPLLKKAFQLLVAQLDERDTVTIAVYAGSSGLALAPTPGHDKTRILSALNQLRSGGGTHGAAGIRLAYDMAEKHFVKGGINRVILATDGDMNVGISSKSALVELVQDKAKSGVFLSVLGFGRGNLKDATMEAIANKGNGNYAYIDSLKEARKVLSDQFGGTLITIAKDVKIQVEFNPKSVAGYRLIGYENRRLAAQDFNDDTKDAGELGAGHNVTALYELVPHGVDVPSASVDALKYQRSAQLSDSAPADELLTLKLRYKQAQGTRSNLVVHTLKNEGLERSSSRAFRWASAVAAFGMLLRDSPHRANTSWQAMIDIASDALGDDPLGHRMEMIVLAKEAKRLAERTP